MGAWDDVEDLEGNGHYEVLEIERTATTAEVRESYRRLAKVHHPDKGGDAERFARLTKAYNCLVDSEARQAYDTWQSQVEFRHVRGVAPRREGGEDLMLDEFQKTCKGEVDPLTQLVITCEVCSRPATVQCWTCKMHICEFCTLKRHWKGGFGLHWPLVNAPGSMLQALGKKEMERKRLDDAKRHQLADPHFRTDHELTEIRGFKDAAYDLIHSLGPEAKKTYDLRLAKYYMWAQTASYVYVAAFVPTGYQDKHVVFEATPFELRLQPEDSPPVIHRALGGRVATDLPIETRRSPDNRTFVASIPKAEPVERWDALFRGDPTGARCIEPPYSLFEETDVAILEVELPFWIEADDVAVDVGARELSVRVRGQMALHKTYWRNREEEKRHPSTYGVVDLQESMWSLDEDTNDEGERCQMLTVSLVKPPLTETETQWKKSKRQDNLSKDRDGSKRRFGVRFFLDDEDDFELEDLLQALCFLEAGSCHVAAKPWDRGATSKRVDRFELLPEAVRGHVENLMKQDEGEE